MLRGYKKRTLTEQIDKVIKQQEECIALQKELENKRKEIENLIAVKQVRVIKGIMESKGLRIEELKQLIDFSLQTPYKEAQLEEEYQE